MILTIPVLFSALCVISHMKMEEGVVMDLRAAGFVMCPYGVRLGNKSTMTILIDVRE